MSAATLLCSKLYGRGQIYLNISIFTREYSAFLCKPCAFLLAVPGMPCATFRLAKRCVLDCHPAHIACRNAPFGGLERAVWRPGRGRFVTLGVPPVALAQSERGLARGKCKAPLCSFRAPLRAARAWLSAAAGRRCLPAAEWRRPRRPVTVS